MSNDPQKFDDTERAADKISNGAGMDPVVKGADRSILLYTVLAIGLALAVRMFIAAPYLVSGPSMESTFQNHDYLIVQKLSACIPFAGLPCLYLGEPQRGDVVIFTLPNSTSQTLIKRVIGIPGDTVTISDNRVTITNEKYPKGLVLSEPYLDPSHLGGASGMRVVLAADQFFVLGDNRKVSYDSRLWGPLPRKDIIGRVLVRLYPFNMIGLLPGEARYQGS